MKVLLFLPTVVIKDVTKNNPCPNVHFVIFVFEEDECHKPICDLSKKKSTYEYKSCSKMINRRKKENHKKLPFKHLLFRLINCLI